jgi:hypothetical protein
MFFSQNKDTTNIMDIPIYKGYGTYSINNNLHYQVLFDNFKLIFEYPDRLGIFSRTCKYEFKFIKELNKEIQYCKIVDSPVNLSHLDKEKFIFNFMKHDTDICLATIIIYHEKIFEDEPEKRWTAFFTIYSNNFSDESIEDLKKNFLYLLKT